MTQRERPDRPALYRSRQGVIFGVCRGIADHMAVSVFGVRLLAIILLFMTGLWPAVFIYIVAALMLKPEPVLPLESDAEEEFYNSYVTSRSMALSRLKRTFDNLDRRIQRIEAIVTAPDYDWERRLYERK